MTSFRSHTTDKLMTEIGKAHTELYQIEAEFGAVCSRKQKAKERLLTSLAELLRRFPPEFVKEALKLAATEPVEEPQHVAVD